MNTGLATSRRFVLVLGLLTALVAFTIDISLPAIPPMVSALETSMSLGQQIVGLFMVGMAAGQIPAGLASDRIGRMPVLYVGIGLFTVTGIVTAVTNDMNTMLAARFLQGVGASAGMVLARAIVRDISSGNQAARMMSIMVMVFTAAPMIAPLLGSYLVIGWGWHAPFAATAVAGFLILYGIRSSLRETHTPATHPDIARQLWLSVIRFMSQRQSLFGLLIVLVTMVGIMSLISGSSALVIEIYDYPVHYFGYLFALTGVAILIGSAINRRLLRHFDSTDMIGVGATIACLAGIQLLVMAWLGDAPFWWLWGCVCLFMSSTGFLIPNATVLALDPVPEIAGVAASVIGTLQSLAGATSAIVSSALYTGTILNLTLVVGVSGIASAVVFLLRKSIIGEHTAENQETSG
ncbi:MAG: multidrug effflux MFS transporter [Proteobacteria bacterium]|nr:multidrug effflux MFS transporter [Pseudomonadota bacterium]MDA0994278.1 multidrug effflux MFS transporter [Pseudomonadota bacterium]